MFKISRPVLILSKQASKELFKPGRVKQLFLEQKFGEAISAFYNHPNPFDASFLISKEQISMADCEQIFTTIQSKKTTTVGLLVNTIKMYQRNNVMQKDYLWDDVVKLIKSLSKDNLNRQMNLLTWNLVMRGLMSNQRELAVYDFIKHPIPTFEMDKKTCTFILSKSVDNKTITSTIMNDLLQYMTANNQVPDIIDYTIYLKKLIAEKNMIGIEELVFRKGIVQLDNTFYAKVFSSCAKFGTISTAERIYNLYKKSNLIPDQYIYSSLIYMFSRFENCNKGMELYREMEKCGYTDLITFTILVSSLIEKDMLDQAIELIKNNLHFMDPSITFRILHSATRITTDLEKSKQIFLLLNELVELSTRDHGRYIDMLIINGEIEQAVDHYNQMVNDGIPIDEYIYSSLFDANIERGTALKIFNSMKIEISPVLASSIIKMFAKYSLLKDARKIFESTKHTHDIILWNSILGAYGSHNQTLEVLKIFNELIDLNIEPNAVTFITLFTACSNSGSINQGKQLFSLYNSKIQQLKDLTVTSSVMNMFAKCGDFESALEIFKSIPSTELTTEIVNVMLSGFSKHGKGSEAIAFFNEYFNGSTTNLSPNEETFIVLLYACGHCNLVDKAIDIYQSMLQVYRIQPNIKHNTALVDAFSRNGDLDSAEELAHKINEKDVVLWMTLLGACRKHNDVPRAERIFNQIMSLNDRHASAYVLMANIYSGSGFLEKGTKVREIMESKGLVKITGQSFLEVDGNIESFVSQDDSHPRRDEIYEELTRLMKEIENAGYSPDTSWVTKGGVYSEEEKKNLLGMHSEKIAMAYAFLTLPPGSTISIFNNLRMCGDCHTATKFVSKVRNCKIVVRDASRFHHFEDGKCSCGDRW